jgi:hypothetical protein
MLLGGHAEDPRTTPPTRPRRPEAPATRRRRCRVSWLSPDGLRRNARPRLDARKPRAGGSLLEPLGLKTALVVPPWCRNPAAAAERLAA